MDLFFINNFFFRTKEIKGCFLSKSTALRPSVPYARYCNLSDQSDCRYFVR